MRGAFFQLPPVLFVRDMVQTYGRLGVSRAAASLAYFLILTLFPLLVCVNFFIGLLELDPEAVFSALDSISPMSRASPRASPPLCSWPACSPSCSPPRRGCAPC